MEVTRRLMIAHAVLRQYEVAQVLGIAQPTLSLYGRSGWCPSSAAGSRRVEFTRFDCARAWSAHHLAQVQPGTRLLHFTIEAVHGWQHWDPDRPLYVVLGAERPNGPLAITTRFEDAEAAYLSEFVHSRGAPEPLLAEWGPSAYASGWRAPLTDRLASPGVRADRHLIVIPPLPPEVDAAFAEAEERARVEAELDAAG